MLQSVTHNRGAAGQASLPKLTSRTQSWFHSTSEGNLGSDCPLKISLRRLNRLASYLPNNGSLDTSTYSNVKPQTPGPHSGGDGSEVPVHVKNSAKVLPPVHSCCLSARREGSPQLLSYQYVATHRCRCYSRPSVRHVRDQLEDRRKPHTISARQKTVKCPLVPTVQADTAFAHRPPGLAGRHGENCLKCTDPLANGRSASSLVCGHLCRQDHPSPSFTGPNLLTQFCLSPRSHLFGAQHELQPSVGSQPPRFAVSSACSSPPLQ